MWIVFTCSPPLFLEFKYYLWRFVLVDLVYCMYCIVGNFQGRLLSQISWFCGYLRENFLRKFGDMVSFGVVKVSNPCKFFFFFFFRKNRIFYQFAKVFSLESFPLYGMCFFTRNLKYALTGLRNIWWGVLSCTIL